MLDENLGKNEIFVEKEFYLIKGIMISVLKLGVSKSEYIVR